MLDLVETIGRLLVHSERNQTEFRNLDGYSFFINLFDTSSADEFATTGSVSCINLCKSQLTSIRGEEFLRRLFWHVLCFSFGC